MIIYSIILSQVASVTFDLLLLLVLGSYLIVLFSFLVITTRVHTYPFYYLVDYSIAFYQFSSSELNILDIWMCKITDNAVRTGSWWSNQYIPKTSFSESENSLITGGKINPKPGVARYRSFFHVVQIKIADHEFIFSFSDVLVSSWHEGWSGLSCLDVRMRTIEVLEKFC